MSTFLETPGDRVTQAPLCPHSTTGRGWVEVAPFGSSHPLHFLYLTVCVDVRILPPFPLSENRTGGFLK